jgi:nucleoside-diphosphate-sugar epimerase
VNIGTGSDLPIADLAAEIARVTGFAGRIDWDKTKPDDTLLKRMDVSRNNAMGWRARIGLPKGLERTYRWLLEAPGLQR